MDWLKSNKKYIILCLTIIVGFGIRLLLIENYPTGLNVDEASAGYEAYSISNYGIDRNGNFMPVFLEAWGSGQNALYTYLLIPFIKIFGLTIFSVRLPMALIGCIALIIMYKLMKNIFDEKMALIAMAFLAICPWHIMKSRWGLESNLFPEIILLSVFTLIYGLKNKKIFFIYLSFAIAGISAYSYGTSYFFLPLFIIPLLIYLVKKKEVNIKQAIISFVIVAIITIPIVLFVIINKFDLPQINLPFMTIPRIAENRFEEVTALFSVDFISKMCQNLFSSVKMLVMQNDGLGWNALNGFGIIYIPSILFTVIGVWKVFSKKDTYNTIINIWFIISVLLLFVCEPNINRCNIIMYPIIYYTIIGIYEIIEKIKIPKAIIIGIYIVEFILFTNTYFKEDFSKYFTFQDNIKEVVEYVQDIDVDTVYMEYSIKEPYIYFLFYGKVDTNEFVKTVEYFRQDRSGFDNVKAFGKYKFYLPEQINPNEKVAYIVPIDEEIEDGKFKITEFKEFKVIEGVEK